MKWFTPQILGPTKITENEQALPLIPFLLTLTIYTVYTSGNFFEKLSDHIPNFLITEKLNYHFKSETTQTLTKLTESDRKFSYQIFKKGGA